VTPTRLLHARLGRYALHRLRAARSITERGFPSLPLAGIYKASSSCLTAPFLCRFGCSPSGPISLDHPTHARDASWASHPHASAGTSRSATLEAAMSDSETETEAPRRSQRERKQAKPFQSGPSMHTTRLSCAVPIRICSGGDNRRKEETGRRLGLGRAGLERRLCGHGCGRGRVGRRGRHGGGGRRVRVTSWAQLSSLFSPSAHRVTVHLAGPKIMA
jgi:hypothetical protein